MTKSTQDDLNDFDRYLCHIHDIGEAIGKLNELEPVLQKKKNWLTKLKLVRTSLRVKNTEEKLNELRYIRKTLREIDDKIKALTEMLRLENDANFVQCWKEFVYFEHAIKYLTNGKMITMDELLKLDGKIQEPESIDRLILKSIITDYYVPLNKNRSTFGYPVIIGSLYRPIHHEFKKWRSGKSQHTFKDVYSRGRGAVDSTPLCNATMAVQWFKLLLTVYNRVTYYPEKKFFHADYKEGANRTYIANNHNEWRVATFEQVERSILKNWDKDE